MKKRAARYAWALVIVVLTIGCDQGSKDYARKHFQDKGTIRVVGSVFVIQYAENDGAFLSAGSKIPPPYKPFVLTLFPALLLLGLIVYVFYNRKLSALQVICMSCIIGGGLSNIYDRILKNGFVTDFMNFGIGNLRTGILNTADLSITFGALSFIAVHYIQEKKTKNLKT